METRIERQVINALYDYHHGLPKGVKPVAEWAWGSVDAEDAVLIDLEEAADLLDLDWYDGLDEDSSVMGGEDR
jgi:hypothetical protein